MTVNFQNCLKILWRQLTLLGTYSRRIIRVCHHGTSEGFLPRRTLLLEVYGHGSNHGDFVSNTTQRMAALLRPAWWIFRGLWGSIMKTSCMHLLLAHPT